MNANDKKALNRITKQAAKVTHSELTSIDDLYCNIVTKKVKCIMANSCHALHDYYVYMRTGTRLRASHAERSGTGSLLYRTQYM